MTKLQKVERTLSNVRRKAREKATQGGHVAAAMIGVASVAYIRGRFPRTRQFGELDSQLVIGGAAIAAGMAELGGKWSDELLFAGVGIISPAIEDRMFKLGESHQ